MINPDWEQELSSFLSRGDAPGFVLVYLNDKEVTCMSNYASEEMEQSNAAMIVYLLYAGIQMVREVGTDWEIKYKN